MTNQTIADFITEKYDRMAALRQARREMFEALTLKAKSAVDSEYQPALDRKAKL
jgi:hypothetical protein